MKTILALLTLLALLVSVQAQTTNIAVRVTVTVVTGVATNTAQTTLNLSPDVPKEKIMIDGAVWEYAAAKVNGQTNAFDFWLARVKIKDEFKATADAFNRVQSAATLAKLTQLLTVDRDLLSASELSSLVTIADKAPTP